MININEYLLSKNKKTQIIYATDETLYRIVRDEIDKLGKDADLNHIDVSAVKNFFYGLDWNDSKPDNLLGLFEGTAFYGDVSGWDMTNAEITTGMFQDCIKFNCDISCWNVENIRRCNYMFRNCIAFRQNLSKWDMKSITKGNDKAWMFERCPINYHKELQPKFSNLDHW